MPGHFLFLNYDKSSESSNNPLLFINCICLNFEIINFESKSNCLCVLAYRFNVAIVNSIHRVLHVYNVTHYLIAILYPQVLWILTSTCVPVLLCIVTGSWVPIGIHRYLITIWRTRDLFASFDESILTRNC